MQYYSARKKEILHLYFKSEKKKVTDSRKDTVRGWGVQKIGERWYKGTNVQLYED